MDGNNTQGARDLESLLCHREPLLETYVAVLALLTLEKHSLVTLAM